MLAQRLLKTNLHGIRVTYQVSLMFMLAFCTGELSEPQMRKAENKQNTVDALDTEDREGRDRNCYGERADCGRQYFS